MYWKLSVPAMSEPTRIDRLNAVCDCVLGKVEGLLYGNTPLSDSLYDLKAISAALDGIKLLAMSYDKICDIERSSDDMHHVYIEFSPDAEQYSK